MSSWNIIICGYLPSPIVVCVPDPSKWTVSNLKQEVIKHVPKAIANDITLYAGDNEVPEGKPLSECSGVRNGTGLLVHVKPFIINVYSPDVDVTVAIEVPLIEFDNWKVSAVLEAICFKLGINYPSKDDILAFNGKSLSDPSSKISSIPDMSIPCLMTYTRFTNCLLSTPEGISKAIFLPQKVDHAFAQSHCFYNRGDYRWLSAWRIVVQQLDGSKIPLLLPDPHKMTIISLREAVQKVLSVPTHQQKLLLGDSHTVLEDWKCLTTTRYSEMLVNDNLSFCDGITLYLIQLTEGIRVNVSKYPQAKYTYPRLGYINIHNLSVFMLDTLATIMQRMSEERPSTARIYLVDSAKSVHSSIGKPVSSVEWITDGCTLTLHDK